MKYVIEVQNHTKSNLFFYPSMYMFFLYHFVLGDSRLLNHKNSFKTIANFVGGITELSRPGFSKTLVLV